MNQSGLSPYEKGGLVPSLPLCYGKYSSAPLEVLQTEPSQCTANSLSLTYIPSPLQHA